MNNTVKHIIKKQVLNINVPRGESSHGVQEQLGRICRQTLPPVLEQVCNAICTEDYRVKLDKIRLDLGALPVAGLEKKILESVAKKLAETLRAYMDSKDENTGETDMQKKSPIAPAALLTYFLATGTLPAWIDSRSIILEQLFDSAMATAPGDISRFLRHAPHKDRLSERLAGMVQPRQLKVLAATLSGTRAFDILIDEMLDFGSMPPKPARLQALKIKASLISYWLHYNPEIPPGSTIKKKGKNGILSGKQILDAETIEKIIKGHIFKENTLQKQNEPMQKAEIQQFISSEALASSIAKGGIKTRNGLAPENHREPVSESKIQPCTIHNAGLVLLWPGIPDLLGACGLIRKDIFVSEAAAERAVLLLQYAADGRTEVPEFELPLNKILCGLAIDTPVPTVFTPKATEKAAVQKLLKTVIEQWKVLKDSSPETLQLNFLQREGSLRPVNGHWQLNIERQTADVLLDRLPWGTGVIKLPWMGQILYTEW